VFAFCYWVNDVKGYRRWSRPFAIYGMNALAVYFLAGIIGRLLNYFKVGPGPDATPLKAYIFQKVYAPLAAPVNASLLYAVSFVLLLYAVAYLMYRRRWFVKL